MNQEQNRELIENIDYVVKHMKNNGELIIKPVDYDVAKAMIVENHYSKKWNTSFGKHNYGIFKDDELLGVAVYGNLMNPKSANKIVESGKVIELNRLWISDKLGHNVETTMLSATFTLLKNNTDYEVIQSFADGRLGVGTIYKASSFKYYGFTESVFFENLNTGETYHQAPFDNTARPKGFLLLNDLRLKGYLTSFKVKTYRYIFKLRKKANILLKEQPYPSYTKGQVYIDKGFSLGQLVRLRLFYENIKYEVGCELIDKELEQFNSNEVISEGFKQIENSYYKKFRDEYLGKDALLDEMIKVPVRIEKEST